jgi:hypothetical protein
VVRIHRDRALAHVQQSLARETSTD